MRISGFPSAPGEQADGGVDRIPARLSVRCASSRWLRPWLCRNRRRRSCANGSFGSLADEIATRHATKKIYTTQAVSGEGLE
jgi:hypothetical protein